MARRPHPIRVAIILDVDDANPDLLYLYIGTRAARLVTQLRAKGINTNLVDIEIDQEWHQW